jgi:putative FmdB family regulatory protein
VPIYDYHCDHCGHSFSQVQSYQDAALTACPRCGKKPRRLMTAPAIVFKGSGWYKTDSRSSPSSSSDGDKGASAKPDAKADAKSEPKGETKSEPKGETKPDKGPAKTGEAAS